MGVTYDYLNDKILNEKFTNIFRSGYINVKGVVLPERYKDFCERIENFQVYDDDVWICSFPKTGTTWTQEMIWMIKNDLDFTGAKVELLERFPFLDHSFLFDYRTAMKENSEFKPALCIENSVRYIEELKRPRFIKTHLPWSLLPKQIREGIRKPKIVYIARNPKDTCISYYHHCKLIEGYRGDFQEFCKLFFDGKVTYCPYWKNVLPFWERQAHENILFLKYENLKSELEGTIKTVANFFSKNLNETQILQLLRHLSFENMKNNKAVNYEGFLEMNKKYKLTSEDGDFIRAGVSGGYKKEMDDEMVKKFDRWIKESCPENELGY